MTQTVTILKGKIHGATVTKCDLNYEGSITIDPALLIASGILPYEKVQVVNCNNGERLETYVIEGKYGEGEICLNGAGARKACEGDKLIIIAYQNVTTSYISNYNEAVIYNRSYFPPKIVICNSDNTIKNVK